MKTIQQWFHEYGQSHQNHTNKLIHWICVPLIFFSITGLLASIPSGALQQLFPAPVQPYIHFGTIVLLLGLLFYLRLSFSMFLGMALVCLVVLLAVRAVAIAFETPLWLICLVVFVLAWIGCLALFIGNWGYRINFAAPIPIPCWKLSRVYLLPFLRWRCCCLSCGTHCVGCRRHRTPLPCQQTN